MKNKSSSFLLHFISEPLYDTADSTPFVAQIRRFASFCRSTNVHSELIGSRLHLEQQMKWAQQSCRVCSVLLNCLESRKAYGKFIGHKTCYVIHLNNVDTFELQINIYGITLEEISKCTRKRVYLEILAKCSLSALHKNWNNSTTVLVSALLVLFHMYTVTDRLITSRSARCSALQGKNNLCKSLISRNKPFQIWTFLSFCDV
jgi:hypothetical protein